MTIDEAIKHCLEVAEKNENDVEVYEVLAKNHENTYSKLTATKYAADCAECAADHRQLAEWLKELKEAKLLLKAAMEDMKMLYETGKDEGCVGIKFKWRHADEALKLIIEGDTNE